VGFQLAPQFSGQGSSEFSPQFWASANAEVTELALPVSRCVSSLARPQKKFRLALQRFLAACEVMSRSRYFGPYEMNHKQDGGSGQ
jgi:hypothetical protein